jgi:hypothetical protein
VPAAFAGVTKFTVDVVEEAIRAVVPPTVTDVAPVRFVPESATASPPRRVPSFLFRLDAFGEPTYVKALAFITDPLSVVTARSTAPAT